jgi:hypothetical protein
MALMEAGESEDPPILGEVAITEADFVRGVRESNAIFRMVWIALLAFGVFLANALWMGGAELFGQVLPSLIGFAVFNAVLLVTPRLAARKLHRALTNSGDSNIFYRFDADGVTLRTPGSTSSVAWRAFARWREGKSAFLLYPSPAVFWIVPKRAFASGDVERVRALLAARVPPQRRLITPFRVFAIWLALIVMFIVLYQLLTAL